VPAASPQVKQIEKTTNHDVKAVEYVLKVGGGLPYCRAGAS
jgi:hypothetical protein